MNLADNLAHCAAVHPTRPAVILDELVIPYAQLAGAAAKVAGWLQSLGVQPGDRVATMMPNVPPVPMLYYGILWAGATVVPMNPLLKAREVAFVMRDSQAKVLFAWEMFAEEAGKGAAAEGTTFVPVTAAGFGAELAPHQPVPLIDRDAEDTAVILYTSGTTGLPKGAELSHQNMVLNARATVGLVNATENDVVFGGLPLFHSFGQTCGMNMAVTVGAALTLVPRFEPTKALEVIARDRVTILEGVPTMYVAFVQHPAHAAYDTSSLRTAVSGGASLPVEVLRGFEAAFDATLLEGYGLSETSPVSSFNHPGRERKAGSIGTPIDGVEMKLIDAEWNETPEGEIGEIAIKGHNIMKGYLNNPEATASVMNDGWFRSGDLATRDSDGYYFIVDRAKDMIIRGGFNVYPREVEELLYEHPAVAEAAVIGVPHETYGEEIVAVVALKADAHATAEEIRAFAKENIAAYKYPRAVLFVDSLPKGPTGKILKREIVVPEGLVE